MATDIMAKAAIATYDTDLQTQLGLKVFLQAVPRNIGQKLRRMQFSSVKEALKEARFLLSIDKKTRTVEVGKSSQLKQNHLRRDLKWR